MERIQTLINKLQEQLQQGATKEQMLYSAQLLVAELTNDSVIHENKVSVLMPTNFIASPNENVVRVELDEKKVEEAEKPVEVEKAEETENVQEVKDVEEVKEVEKTESDKEVEKVEDTNDKQETFEAIDEKVIEKSVEENSEVAIEPMVEVFKETPKEETPKETIFFTKPIEKPAEKNIVKSENKVIYELNDLSQDEHVSLNDKLKESRVEVAHTIVDNPVKDLRKAIGINDKYLFINELFSQDESMYERSIKTINNFGTYKEAEQWINRELYTKLCWLKDNKIVDNFYNLVKRRFAEM